MWVDRMNEPQNSFHERARVVQIFIGKSDFFFAMGMQRANKL